MVIVKATKDSEAGVMPGEKLITEMGKFNEELVKRRSDARRRRAPSQLEGCACHVFGGERTVIDGPFPETKELIAGFWLWNVKSKEEAIEWVKRCPNPYNADCEVEIRQVFEACDFGA